MQNMDAELTLTIKGYVEQNQKFIRVCQYENNDDNAVHYRVIYDNPNHIMYVVIIYDEDGDCFGVSLFTKEHKLIKYIPDVYYYELAEIILENLQIEI